MESRKCEIQYETVKAVQEEGLGCHAEQFRVCKLIVVAGGEERSGRSTVKESDVISFVFCRDSTSLLVHKPRSP